MRGEVPKRGKNWYYRFDMGMDVSKEICIKEEFIMSGHLRKRSNKCDYSFEKSNVDGKKKRIERVGGLTKKEAQQALRKAMLEYENAGAHFDPVNM